MAEGRVVEAHPPLARPHRDALAQVELLLKYFSHFIDSDVALLYQVGSPGGPPTVSCSWA